LLCANSLGKTDSSAYRVDQAPAIGFFFSDFYFLFSEFVICCISSRLTMRGGRVVTIARRDAVDAGGIVRRAMRAADGEVVWSWHPLAGAKLARR
jgi:hypothetical protein